MPSTSAPSCGRGTPTSSSSRVPVRSTAGMALRRATTNCSPSSGSSVENTSVAWFSSQIAEISSHSAAAWPAGSSDWMTSIAAASRSRPIFVMSSTALMVGRSMNSSIEGRSRRVMASTVAVASSRVANVATRVAGGRCFGISRSDHLGDDAERPLAADEQLGQRQAGDVLEPGPAEPHRGAVGEHHGQAEHVVGGDAVLHAAQAAGVGGDVAADRADLVRRRVRRVPEAVLGRRRLHLGVHQRPAARPPSG